MSSVRSNFGLLSDFQTGFFHRSIRTITAKSSNDTGVVDNMAETPEMLSRVIGEALGIPSPKLLECETGPDGRPWFIGFEWNGRADYLNEGGDQGRRTRGSNCTSADAIVRFSARRSRRNAFDRVEIHGELRSTDRLYG